MPIEIETVLMPPGFRYAHVLEKGRPQHGIPGEKTTYDTFFIKHPPMENSRRAKIFSPFDALAGFNEAVVAKRIQYEERRELTESKREELDRKLAFLQSLINDQRRYGERPVTVCITYFEPCEDPESEAFGEKGIYRTVSGSLEKINPLQHRIILDCGSIQADDIIEIDYSVTILEG